MKTLLKHPMPPGLLAVLLAAICCLIAPGAFGQSTAYIWTNRLDSGSSAQIGVAGNWNPNGIPNPNSNVGNPGDTIQWDGQTTGPMYIDSNGGMNGGSSAGVVGIVIYVDGNQTSPVNIYYSGSGANGTSIRTSNIQVDSGGGQLSLGNTNSSTSSLYLVMGGTSGQIHQFVNNSVNPVIMYPALKTAMGGGGAHTYDFGGSGNWYVTNSLYPDNSGSDTILTKDGTGTLVWQYASEPTYAISGSVQGPVTINQGTVVLESGNLLVNLVGSQNMLNNGSLFEYAGQANSLGSVANGTISLNISGTGPVQVASGVLTLSGTSTYTGTNILTGGELIAGSVETANPSGPLGEANPPQGSISFQGGILGYSAFNGFDYSPRFDTSPGQQYQIDTASQNVTYTNGLTSPGGTLVKLGGGSLTLAGANTYGGLTTVSVGKLVLAGASGNGNINVADNAALGVVENGTPFTPNTLTLGQSSGATFEANNVTNKSVAPMHPANLASVGLTTINVNSGRFRLIGDTFPLLTWGAGAAPATSLAFVSGAGGHLVTNVNTLDLVIDQPPYIWTGENSGVWVAGAPNNWEFSGGPVNWANGNYALFDDSLGANSSVTISGVITGQTITFDNINTNYTLTSSDASDNLGGSSSVTMAGSGITTLTGGANTYTGPTTISAGGTVVVGALANGGAASDIGASSSSATNLVFNSGSLQYTGMGSTNNRLFSLGTGGGTIDNEGAGTLALTNTGLMGLVSSGPRNLNLTGVDVNGTGDTLAVAVGDGGGPTSLTKNGAGNWTLTGANTYSGGTTIVAGELFVGNGGATGSLGLAGVNDATALDFNRTGSVTVTGPITGAGTLTNDGPGTVILANNNSYAGGTEINQGTLQVGNGGGAGSLNSAGAIDVEGLLSFNSSGSHLYSSPITGAGNVIVGGGGLEECIGANTYTGWTLINAGTIFQPCNGNQGALVTLIVTNNGTLRFDRQDTGTFTYIGNIVGSGAVQNAANNNNAGNVTLTGTNTYTGGTFIGDNTLIFGDNNGGDGMFIGNVTFTNNWATGDDNQRELDLNIANNITISGNIVTNFANAQNNQGIVQLDGSGTITLTGVNSYGGGTIINNGALEVGVGATGSVGTGAVTFNNGNNGLPFVINISSSIAIPGAISGGGVNVVKTGSGTVTLGGANTYNGSTTVSNGGWFVNGSDMASSTYVTNAVFGGIGAFAGPVTLDAGTTFEPGASAPPSAVGTMTINSDLMIGGNIVFSLNNKLAQPNTMVNVSGILTNTGTGTLTLKNVGNGLVPGEKFTLFSEAVSNGAAITVLPSARATWVNNLAVDGSVSVVTVGPKPKLNVANLGNGSVTLSWTDSSGADTLQVQTNSLSAGLGNNWTTFAGSSPLTVPMVRTFTNGVPTKTNSAAVFYRLIAAP